MTMFGDQIKQIADRLRKGETILYPTDTIWGLGCDAYNEEAVEKIYALKKRDRDKPMILLVNSISMLKGYIDNIHPRVETLLVYFDRPITIVYEPNERIPDFLLSKDGTIAIRVIQSNFCLHLIDELKSPIISTSANVQGEPTPKTLDQIDPVLKKKIDIIIPEDIEEKMTGESSILVGFNKKSGKLKFFRK